MGTHFYPPVWRCLEYLYGVLTEKWSRTTIISPSKNLRRRVLEKEALGICPFDGLY